MYIEISDDTFATRYSHNSRASYQTPKVNNVDTNNTQNQYKCECYDQKNSLNIHSRTASNGYLCKCSNKYKSKEHYSNFRSFNENNSSISNS